MNPGLRRASVGGRNGGLATTDTGPPAPGMGKPIIMGGGAPSTGPTIPAGAVGPTALTGAEVSSVA